MGNVRGELFAQPERGAPHLRLDGAERHAQPRGDLADRGCPRDARTNPAPGPGRLPPTPRSGAHTRTTRCSTTGMPTPRWGVSGTSRDAPTLRVANASVSRACDPG